ncbi:MAG TPA: thiolase family protein [Acidimicrobiia bacterium]|jgi:acetyl-CoA acetyltransferase|nr:thiolase family protein [Acidimicrobiia bacterium]
MSPRFTAQNRVAIAGYAQSPIVRHADRPLGAVAVDTARAAIADAGLAVADVDGFTTGSILPSSGGQASVDGVSIVTANWMAEALGVNPRFCAGFQGYGQIPGSVTLAVNAIASGAADVVLVHRALHNPPRGRYHSNPMTRAAGSAQWGAPQGFFGPLSMIALPYNEYLQRYGASRESMANVVVEARENGARIPWSYWYDRPITADEYLDARVLSDPICMYDCDIPVDGVAAFVFTTAERARDLPNPPVYVGGFAQGHPERHRLPMHWPLDDIMDVAAETCARLWAHSGLSVDDVDVPQLYDGFSPFVYFWLEALGYCPVGEAHRFVQDGGIRARDGGLPVLSGGGALGNGRMHGVPQMLECYLQLARRAGDRQLPSADVGLACHSSPHWGGAVLYSREPL